MKIINNILITMIWLAYFFMSCINLLNDEFINGLIIFILSIITLLLLLFDIKTLRTSKTIFIASLFTASYFISMLVNKIGIGNIGGVFCAISFLVGIILIRAVCINKENINNVLFAVSSIITLVGLISIDMASFNLISTYLGLLVELVAGINYRTINVFEAGIRMKSIVTNPNIFASLTAIAIFINLYLYEIKHKEKFSLCMLLINITAFIYAFSLGASLVLLICFIVYIIINRKNEILNKLYVLILTGIISFFCVVVGILGMGKDGVISILPLISLFVGGILLNGLIVKKEKFINNILPKIMKYKKVYIIIFIIVILFGSSLIKPVKFDSSNLQKSMSVRLDSGDYNLKLIFDRNVDTRVVIQGQTYSQASKREYDVLFDGELEGKDIDIDFSTYSDNKAINIIVNVNNDTELESAKIIDKNNGLIKSIKMDYTLIPNFIENRLSPFSSNQNAIQRFTFFLDGIKIWLQSPLIGNGPSGFLNNIEKVQTSVYSTWSSHNFIIDILCDTGIIGAICMISILLYNVILIIKRRKLSEEINFFNTMGVIILYIILHSLIELNFVYIPYILTTGIVCGIISAKTEKPIKNKWLLGINTILPVIIIIISIVSIAIYFR